MSTLKGWKFTRVDAVGLTAALVLGGAFYWLAVQPIVDLRQCQAAQQSRLQSQRQDRKDLAAQEQEIRSSLAHTRTELKACPLQLEAFAALNAKIQKLVGMATGNELKVDQILPAEPAYGRDFGTVPVRLAGSGGYRTWTLFLHQLSQQFPDMAVNSFELTGKPDAPNSPVEFRVNLEWHIAPANAVK